MQLVRNLREQIILNEDRLWFIEKESVIINNSGLFSQNYHQVQELQEEVLNIDQKNYILGLEAMAMTIKISKTLSEGLD